MKNEQIAEKTTNNGETKLTRRTVLDWIGKAAVISLGSEFLLHCEDGSAEALASPDGAPDGASGAGFGFEPGGEGQAIFRGWGERTVDPQTLVDILKKWTLRVDGLVEQPVTLSFSELISLKRLDSVADFHCVEGWSVLDVPWNGVHLSTLAELVKPLDSAKYVTFHTLGNQYNESLPLAEALEPKTMLAFGVGGDTLPLKHGFPLRLVVPRKYAYKSAKYVYRVEFFDKPVPGYWVQAGYPYEADVPKSKLRPGRY